MEWVSFSFNLGFHFRLSDSKFNSDVVVVVVVVVVVLPGPQSFRLMLVADESGLPAELYSTICTRK